MQSEICVDECIERARTAQSLFAKMTQRDYDRAAKAIGKIVYDNAEELATLAVTETGMGLVESKIAKCRNKAKSTWWRMVGKKTCGIIDRDSEPGIVKIAKPVGVVGCVTASTNPVINPMHNSMCALKCGNASIISPHPGAKRTAIRTVELMRSALKAEGLPEDLIQVIPEPTIEISQELMQKVDVCIGTGGKAVVHAAYSSGKPAYGVGQGNVQVLVDRDADLDDVAKKTILGRTFDNGVLCTCEQNIICPREKEKEMIKALEDNGAFYIGNDEDVQKIRDNAFPEGRLNKRWPGASVMKISEMTDIYIPEGKRVVVCRTNGYGREEVLAKEKLFPVLALFLYDTWEDCMEIARANLAVEGMGHSVVIHSHNSEHIEAVPSVIDVSRYTVNQCGATSLGGAMNNGLNPTTTLGCGTWGNNIISENLWYIHLMNISRIAYEVPDMYVPTDEEIWATN